MAGGACRCIRDGPLHSVLPSQGLFRNCRRRWGEIRLGGVIRHRKGECCFFFSVSLSLSSSLCTLPPLEQCFCVVTSGSWRGSRRSRQRQSQQSSDSVRNAAVLYCFFSLLLLLPFSIHPPPQPRHPPFVSPYWIWLQCWVQIFERRSL